MSYTDKENVTSPKQDIYRDSAKNRREQFPVPNNSQPIHPEDPRSRPTSLYHNYKPSQMINEQPKSISYILSPNRENSKFIQADELGSSKSVQDNPELNTSGQLSTFSINESAQKQLNYSRTTVSFRQGINVDNLISICSKKLEIEPTHKKALFIRASSYMKKGFYFEAIKDCNALLTLDSHNVGGYYCRGCAFEKLGEIDKGIEDFTRVLHLDPNHVNAAFARGACNNRKGDFAAAIEDYNMALEKDIENGPRKAIMRRSSKVERSEAYSNDLTGSGNKGKMFMSPTGRPNQGRVNQFGPYGTKDEDLLNPDPNNHLMQMDNSAFITNDLRGPSYTTMLNSTNRSFMKNNDDNVSMTSDASFQEPNSTLKLKERKLSELTDPESMKGSQKEFKDTRSKAEWYHSQGFDARKRGDFHMAIEYYTKALEIFPNHFKALFNRGFAFDKIGNYDAAIEDYTNAIKLDPKNAYAFYNRGISLDRKEEYDEAIKNFSIAISIEPNKADFHHNRGFAYRKKKNFPQAIADYTKAIELDQSHFKAYYNRAFCYDKLGHLKEAEQDYIIALKLQPKNINALHHLGSLFEKISGERLPEALECFNQYENEYLNK